MTQETEQFLIRMIETCEDAGMRKAFAERLAARARVGKGEVKPVEVDVEAHGWPKTPKDGNARITKPAIDWWWLEHKLATKRSVIHRLEEQVKALQATRSDTSAKVDELCKQCEGSGCHWCKNKIAPRSDSSTLESKAAAWDRLKEDLGIDGAGDYAETIAIIKKALAQGSK